jgi:hypothetical protein
MEQVLSQLAPEGQKTLATNRQAATPSQAVSNPAAAPVRKTESASPFEADRARKIRSSEPQMSEGPTIQAQSAAAGTAVAVAAPENSDDPSKILGYVLNELENAGHKTLASVLETGSVALTGNELTVTVARTPSVIDVLMGMEQKRAANAAASAIAGRPLKVVVVSGMPANGAAPVVRPSGTNGTSARSRAAEDPVVRRMQEKFGAEIRTVIDHREKN